METTIFKTPLQKERENRDMEIYQEYNRLTSVEGQSRTAVNEHLMKKYGIHSPSTLYQIRYKVEQRLKGNA